jgi:hypothetical protein
LQGAEFGYLGVAVAGESAEVGADVWPCFKIASSRSDIAPGGGGGTIRYGGGVAGAGHGVAAQPDRASRHRPTTQILQFGKVRICSRLRTLAIRRFRSQLLLEFLDLGANFVTALFLQVVYAKHNAGCQQDA